MLTIVMNKTIFFKDGFHVSNLGIGTVVTIERHLLSHINTPLTDIEQLCYEVNKRHISKDFERKEKLKYKILSENIDVVFDSQSLERCVEEYGFSTYTSDFTPSIEDYCTDHMELANYANRLKRIKKEREIQAFLALSKTGYYTLLDFLYDGPVNALKKGLSSSVLHYIFDFCERVLKRFQINLLDIEAYKKNKGVKLTFENQFTGHLFLTSLLQLS